MQEAQILLREPLLDGKGKVLGYELSPVRGQSGGEPSEAAFEAIAAFAQERDEGGALLGDQLLFVAATPELLKSGALLALPSAGTVVVIHARDLGLPETRPAMTALRAAGYGVSIRDGSLDAIDKSVLGLATHLELPIEAEDFDFQVGLFRKSAPGRQRLIARDVTDWLHFDACARLDLDVFVGHLHLVPREQSQAREINPAQRLILQLMDLVRKNADVPKIEALIKRDPALSFRLLRYINSAGFGLGCEIQSLRHAVSLLGYQALYRWLSVLLATATSSGYAPALMQTAIIRGRFAELLGRGLLPKSEAENLFVAGMFSLLDRLLGMSMETVLSQVQLSEAVGEALLSRQGMYGPFLALAEACEMNPAKARMLASTLCMEYEDVNKAHLAALAWAQGVKL